MSEGKKVGSKQVEETGMHKCI